jgi:hypothetical protein
MKIALERKQRFPELFSGYDLVAQEDLGRPLSDLAPELIWFREQTEYLNLTIPFFFHAGETLGDGNATDYNLVDAILFNSRRIGHGFSLYKHPTLIEEVIEKAVMVEVCPISNEVLRLATDILHHPLPAMIAHGVPTAISNDDPAILGQDIAGVSYDFYQTIQGFDNIGLAGLVCLPVKPSSPELELTNHRELWRKTVSAGQTLRTSRMLTGFEILIWPRVVMVSKLSAFGTGISSGRSFANGLCPSMVTSILPLRFRSPTRSSRAFDCLVLEYIIDSR